MYIKTLFFKSLLGDLTPQQLFLGTLALWHYPYLYYSSIKSPLFSKLYFLIIVSLTLYKFLLCLNKNISKCFFTSVSFNNVLTFRTPLTLCLSLLIKSLLNDLYIIVLILYNSLWLLSYLDLFLQKYYHATSKCSIYGYSKYRVL